jgi:excinuclease ABC subunit B
MFAAAEALEFERAAALRDRIQQMRAQMGKRLGDVKIEPARTSPRGGRRRHASGKRVPRPKKG